MTKRLPLYLLDKLAALQMDSLEQLMAKGYLESYAQLKASYPSLNHRALFDLYCLAEQIDRSSLDQDQQRQLIKDYHNLPPRHSPLASSLISANLELAHQQALIAAKAGEVPIGAIIVHQQQVIAATYNRTRSDNNILAHAETLAIAQAQLALANYRLNECDLYVTIEPCLMCSGAVIHSRIKRVIFGACEPKTGAALSQYQVFDKRSVNHHTQLIGPFDQAKYSHELQRFFAKR